MLVNKHRGTYRPALKPIEMHGFKNLPPLQQIPELSAHFVGRQFEVERIHQHLDRERVAAIIGMAGSGKTALMTTISRSIKPLPLWIDLLPNFNNNPITLLWQLAQPLAQLRPDVWETLHRFAQSKWQYPPLVYLQAIVAAYRYLKDPIMICIDSIENATDSTLKQMIITLCEYTARTQNPNLRIIIAGRYCPYKLKNYAITDALSGLTKENIAQWANNLALNFDDETINRIYLQTGGLPEAITRFFAIAVNDHSLSMVESLTGLSTIRRFLTDIVASLTPEERRILMELSTKPDGIAEVSFETLLDFKRLEDLHIAIPYTATTVTAHPIFQQFYRQTHV